MQIRINGKCLWDCPSWFPVDFLNAGNKESRKRKWFPALEQSLKQSNERVDSVKAECGTNINFLTLFLFILALPSTSWSSVCSVATAPMYHCLSLVCNCKIRIEEFGIVGGSLKNPLCVGKLAIYYRLCFFKTCKY